MTTTRASEQSATAPAHAATIPIDAYVSTVAAEGQAFAAAARLADWDTAVPAGPGWDVRTLVRHLSEIHLWAASNVALRPGAKLDLDDHSDLTVCWPDLAVFWPDDNDLIDWYLTTNATLVDALTSAPADVAAETFLPAPSPLAMWARRQAHETAIHRFDAEAATGTTNDFDPAFAADGVSELLYAFYEDVPRSEARAISLDRDHTMRIHAHDTGDDWYMTMGRRSIRRGDPGAPIDLTLTGTASDLYLALWNRGTDSAITAVGDRGLLELWHTVTGVRWDLA